MAAGVAFEIGAREPLPDAVRPFGSGIGTAGSLFIRLFNVFVRLFNFFYSLVSIHCLIFLFILPFRHFFWLICLFTLFISYSTHSFVYLIYSFNSFILVFPYSLPYSLRYSFIHFFIYHFFIFLFILLFILLFTPLFTPLFIYLFTPLFIYLFTPLYTPLFTPLFVYSFTLFIHLFNSFFLCGKLQMQSQLYHVTHQFNNLSGLYEVMDGRIRALNSGVNDKLRDKSRAIYLLSLHLQTVLWFVHGGLLPEIDSSADSSAAGSPSLLPYPRRQLEEFYRKRRIDIERLGSDVCAKDVLLIEQMLPDSVIALWADERRNFIFFLLFRKKN